MVFLGAGPRSHSGNERAFCFFHAVCGRDVSNVHRAGIYFGGSAVAMVSLGVGWNVCGGAPDPGVAFCEFSVGRVKANEEENMKRFIQFCMVGTSGVFVDMGVLFLLSEPAMLGWPAPLGKAFAVEVAILNNFVWNEMWTFGDLTLGRRGYLRRLNRFGRFNAICLMGLVIGVSVIWVLHGQIGWNLYLANLSAIGIVTGWNFGMNYKFSWGTPELKQPFRAHGKMNAKARE
jgi:putative flippase GtrA